MINKLEPPDTETKARQYVHEFGMVLGELEPAFTIKLTERQTAFIKSAAQFQVEEEGGGGWSSPFWEGAYLTEFALHNKLKEDYKKHRWAGLYFGESKLAPRDFILWCKGKRYTIGLSSRRHVDLVLRLDDPVQFYAYRRLQKSKERISSYTFSSSVFGHNDGTTTVAYWGGMTRLNLVRNLEEQRLHSAHPSRGDYVSISLKAFDQHLLLKLLQDADES